MITKMTQLWPVIGVFAAMSAIADQVITEDLIVNGAACVGLDCVRVGEPFVADELKLKENNLRIRFIDTTVNPVPESEQILGQKWNIEANSSVNGGASYFGFQLKQEKTGNVMAEDEGRVLEYDCDGTSADFDDFLFEELLTGGFIAVGDPIEVPAFVQPLACSGTFPDFRCDVECVPGTFVSERSLLRVGNSDEGEPFLGKGVALGYESANESGVVSVGRVDLQRRIAHVAAGLASTDVATVAGLNGLSQQLAGFNAELDEIEARIAIVEVFHALSGTASGADFGGSLSSKVTNAEAAYQRGNIISACNILDAFQNQVVAQTGKKLAAELAAQLIAEAQAVKNQIGCT
jgi:hypothetical protein